MSKVDNQIRSLVNSANSYQAQINSARGRYNAALGKQKKYEERLRRVTTVKNNLLRKFDGHVDGTARKQNSLKDELARAVRGPRSSAAHANEIEHDRERRIESDSSGSQINHNLQLEIQRCEAEVRSASQDAATAEADMHHASSKKDYCVSRARELSKSSDATIRVR